LFLREGSQGDLR